MKLSSLFVSAVLASTLLPAASLTHAATATIDAAHAATGGIAWQTGDVDAAFALAKQSNKPLFLYWGAVWCPPCNQVKATIFNRQDFIERSKFFVPVYIDGDSASAQKLGTRFKVRGYPSMILFRPDGSEIIRLPGEVDGARYLQVLELGMNAAHPVKETLPAALQGGSKISADDWRLLAYYSWDTDEQQLVDKEQVGPTLQKLASLCPLPEIATRLQLKAWAALLPLKPEQRTGLVRDAAGAKLLAVLADPKTTRENMDLLLGYGADLTELVSDAATPLRQKLATAWDAALPKLLADGTLSKADRVGVIAAQVALARLTAPKGELAPEWVASVQARLAEVDKSTQNPYERQAVISDCAHILSDLGLLEQSDALLLAELKRSQSPYYYMLTLASNAKQRKDSAGALNWYEQAYQAAKGPATRLQWGASYLTNLLELAPQDEARIEKAANGVLTELAATPDAFYERNRGSLEKIGKKLNGWNADGKHQQVFGKVKTQLNGICAKLPGNDGQKGVCEALLAPAKAG
jgi:thioredoxin-related protein